MQANDLRTTTLTGNAKMMTKINAEIKQLIGKANQTDEYICEMLKDHKGYDYPTIDAAIEKMVEDGVLIESIKECGEFGMVCFLRAA